MIESIVYFTSTIILLIILAYVVAWSEVLRREWYLKSRRERADRMKEFEEFKKMSLIEAARYLKDKGIVK